MEKETRKHHADNVCQRWHVLDMSFSRRHATCSDSADSSTPVYIYKLIAARSQGMVEASSFVLDEGRVSSIGVNGFFGNAVRSVRDSHLMVCNSSNRVALKKIKDTIIMRFNGNKAKRKERKGRMEDEKAVIISATTLHKHYNIQQSR